jgi:translation initiation factor IF-2
VDILGLLTVWQDMITGEKGSRLSKIARELNVGISTLVEFLHKQGIKISSDPNQKIEADVHELLEKQFKKDLEARIEADKLNLRHHRVKNESISIEDIKTENKESDETEVDDDSVMIKDHSIHQYKEEKRGTEIPAARTEQEIAKQESVVPKPAPSKPAPVADVDKPKVKVVGQVDLESLKRKPKIKEIKPEIQEKVQEVEEVKPSVQVEEKPIPEEKSVEQPTPKEETEIIALKEAKEKEKKEETEKEKEEIEKIKTPESVVEKKPETQEKPAETPPEQEEHEPEKISNIPVREPGIKVVGKIELESPSEKPKKEIQINKKKLTTHKGGESIKAAQERKPARLAEHPVEQEPEKTEEIQEEIFKLERKKLSGPTVVGKIELPVEEKKKSSWAEDHQARKKKRKRVSKESKERVDVTEKKVDKIKEKPEKSKKKISLLVKKKGPVKQEVKEEDVQKQIKETLARLTTKGQKTKGSKYRRDKRLAFSEKMAEQSAQEEMEKNILKVTEFVSVNELASMMNVPPTEVIATCMSLGLFVSINQRLDAETMAVVADEFGYKVEFISVEVQEAIEEDTDHEDDLISRPPIVTVMGHVDHGKTSLLDYIRKSNVIAGEAGGITQHIGAYNVTLENGRKITFLDTPGHEAFTAMRARGAQVTDIAIIIVAADDDVMPQTKEAINHAQAASVPIVFAINKVDKPTANPDKIKEELANMNMLIEEWGGKYQSQDLSAKTGLGVGELLEKVLLEADLLELKANPDKRAVGSVIESSLDKGRGYVATVLVQNGTLKVGDVVLAGPHFGHIKAMFNERNQRVEEAGPSEPVLILGLNGAPQAGDKFNVIESEREARLIANKREQLQREQGLRTQKHITLDEIGRRIAIGNFQELNIIVKGDVDGSIEALSDSLIKLSVGEIQVNVIHKAVGQITESDVMLASASNAIIVGFQVRPSLSARKLAEKEGIDIRLYSIIYDAINEVKSAMEGMLAPEIKEEIKGTAEIMETFKITKVGTIAGCMVRDGKIGRNSKIRLIRDGIVVYTGELESLKRFKDDVKEVVKGYECGLNIRGYNDLQVGDFVEAFEEVEVAKTLD